MKILMLGAGGVGGYFGARLHEAGGDISFLVRAKRSEILSHQGLIVETPTQTFRIEPQLVTKDKLLQNYDLVMLSPKAYDLEDSLETVKEVPGNPLYLPLLNGFDHLKRMDDEFGRERVMGGVAHIAAELTEKGVVRQLNSLHRFTFGTRHVCQESSAAKLKQLTDSASFDSVQSKNIEQSLWDKWTFLATLAAMNTLMRANVGVIESTEFGGQATLLMFEECCSIAEKSGFPISEAVQTQSLGILRKENSDFTASMMRDLESGHQTEHEHIIGSMLRRGKQAKLGCPSLQLAYTQMTIRERNES
ncbi:MAG: 2-dehydropantoate 2-reductase [Verrucomicrobiales bacterium]|nr:2-dehydropantoate 2-reductase [Verrucomicrobiales bacterium]